MQLINKKMKNVLIIGAGIHGTLLSIEIKKKLKTKVNIDLVEKNKTILSGTSNSTHNRSNRGFHYPRSLETTKECKLGWNYFQKYYYDCFHNIGNSYYLVEKNSKTSVKKYENFLLKNNYKFKKKFPLNFSCNKRLLKESFEVFEGCFDHKKLSKKILKQINHYNINLITNFEIKKIKYIKSNIVLTGNKKKIQKKYDLIVNCTYADAYKILNLMGIKNKKNIYKVQNTIIPVVYCEKKIPGLTVIDGPYCTIMPYSSHKSLYLLYDVKNSVSLKKISHKEKEKRYNKIKKKFEKYFLEKFNFKLKKFLMGKRPIPISNFGDRRSTKIIKNKFKNINIISVCEGKYISAPYMAKKLANEL
jgi:hypothetical protein